MHNLNPYSGDAFSLFEEAVDRKANGDSKNRLIEAKATIKAYYDEFDSHFKNNTLQSIPPKRVKKPLKDDLCSMYSFDAALVKKVKVWLKENNPPTVFGVCQQCGIVSFNTMDHILPRTRYSEYAVHPKNLIPCCSDCNDRKNDREILNLYIDILPKVEYLFMDVKANGDTIDLIFRLDNSKGLLSKSLFNKINNHYENLNLIDRFRTYASSKVVSFLIGINKTYIKYGKQEVIENINENIEELRRAYGFNFWEVAFQKGLINSPVFWDYYTSGKF